AQETVDGFIAEETRGPNGFGYDPLFFYPPFGRTFGETRPEDKDRVSHRGKAFARLKRFLASLPAETGITKGLRSRGEGGAAHDTPRHLRSARARRPRRRGRPPRADPARSRAARG